MAYIWSHPLNRWFKWPPWHCPWLHREIIHYEFLTIIFCRICTSGSKNVTTSPTSLPKHTKLFNFLTFVFRKYGRSPYCAIRELVLLPSHEVLMRTGSDHISFSLPLQVSLFYAIKWITMENRNYSLFFFVRILNAKKHFTDYCMLFGSVHSIESSFGKNFKPPT